MKKFFFVKKKDIPHYGPSGHVFVMAFPPNWSKTQNAWLGGVRLSQETDTPVIQPALWKY